MLFLPELAQYTDKLLLLENTQSFAELKTLYKYLPSVLEADMPNEQLRLWALQATQGKVDRQLLEDALTKS